MYFDINNQQLINNHPNTVFLNNGTVVSGKNLSTAILANAGYLTVRSDTPEQPEDTVEDVSQRVINIDGDFVDVVRTWIADIPESISARQVRLWLISNNIELNSVIDTINTIEDVALRQKTLTEWEYAPYIERNHPLIENLGASLGLSPQQIDQGFLQASKL